MKKNQSGFSAVVPLLLIIVLLIGGIGLYVWKTQNNKSSTTTPSPQGQTDTNNNQVATEPDSTEKKEVSPFVTEVDIELATQADLSKLPSVTPDSFKAYMKEQLAENAAKTDCYKVKYLISRVSIANIKGGQVPLEESCSGAPGMWVLNPNNGWDYESVQSAPCKSTNGGLVYVEFAEECWNGSALIKNPNGSLKQLSN